MKGGGGYFYGLRMKQLSLFFIVFVCASIVVWNWEKTPHLTTLLPPHDQVLQPFPGLCLCVNYLFQHVISVVIADGKG